MNQQVNVEDLDQEGLGDTPGSIDYSEERDYEAEARAQGWKPPEELPEDFKGEPVDAKTFVERGEQFVSLLKPRLDKMEKKLQYQEQINQDFKAQIERERAQKRQEIEQLENQLKQARRQAVTDGDGDAYDEAERQLEQLQSQKAEYEQSQAPTATGFDPNEIPDWAVQWERENPWFGQDTTATAVAEKFAVELRESNPYLSEKEFLDEVAKHVKNELPHKFRKSPGQHAPDVEGEGGRRSPTSPGGSNAKNYNNLPNDAKKECSRLINEGIIKDKEQYAEIYFSDNV